MSSQVIALKRLFEVVNGSTPKSDNPDYWDGDIPWVSPVDLSNDSDKFISSTSRKITKAGLDSCGTSIVPAGSIILSCRAPIGSIGISLVEMCTNQGCKSLVKKSKNISEKFYYYVLSAANSELNSLGKGTTFLELSTDTLSDYKVPNCSLDRQQKIANFLDRETAKIDELIQKQEELIELSEKRKKQLTLETLTLGVRKNTDTKSSNLLWAPEIPSNWSVYALKRIASMQSGSSITAEQIEEDGLYPVFGGGGFRGYTSEYTHEGIYPLIGRQGALCGNVNFSKDKFWASEHAVVVSPIKNIDPIWLGLLLRSMNLGQYSMSAAQPGLSVDVIKNLLAPIPSYEEQLEISDFLNKEYSRIDSLIEKSKVSIVLLREHRASLISAAVTGKIDVRGLS